MISVLSLKAASLDASPTGQKSYSANNADVHIKTSDTTLGGISISADDGDSSFTVHLSPDNAKIILRYLEFLYPTKR